MADKENSVSRLQVWVYAGYGAAQTLSYRVPMIYGQMYMTQYMGVPIATAALVLTIAKFIDFCFALMAGGIIQSANPKKGKYLPWMKALRWVIAMGAVLRMAPVRALPVGARAACASLGYVMIHGSMNFMSTAQRGLLPKLGGSDMEQRVLLTTRQTQVNSFASVILSFGTLPLITLAGKLAGDVGIGYTIITVCFAPAVLIGVSLLEKAVGPLDRPPESPSATHRSSVRELLAAVFTNDQMTVYMVYQILSSMGGSVISGMTMYYWSVVMNRMGMYSVASGISACAPLVFALLLPRLGKTLGKRKAVLVNFAIMLFARVLMATLALKSIWFMALANLLEKAGDYLTAIYGVNYYLDIGEYGYHKTGRDFRTLCMSLSNIPGKIASALGGAMGGILLARISFDRFQGLYAAANKLGSSGDWSFRASEEFTCFCGSFIRIYAFAPLCFSAVAICVFLFGYKITDENARYYAKMNAAKVE